MTYKFSDRFADSGCLIYSGVTTILTIVLFLVCRSRGFCFFTGIDYSGHGFWSWFGILCSSGFLSVIVTILFLWVFGKAAKKPIGWLFVIGIVLLALCIFGVPKLMSNPALFEVIFGGLAANFIYWSLVIEKEN